MGTRGENPLICIGINPSTAEPDNLDNTLKSVSRIAGGTGFDSWIMFNVYAQRATRPDDMDRELNRELHEENMAAFRYILSNVAQGISPAIWAAWGTIGQRSELRHSQAGRTVPEAAQRTVRPPLSDGSQTKGPALL